MPFQLVIGAIVYIGASQFAPVAAPFPTSVGSEFCSYRLTEPAMELWQSCFDNPVRISAQGNHVRFDEIDEVRLGTNRSYQIAAHIDDSYFFSYFDVPSSWRQLALLEDACAAVPDCAQKAAELGFFEQVLPVPEQAAVYWVSQVFPEPLLARWLASRHFAFRTADRLVQIRWQPQRSGVGRVLLVEEYRFVEAVFQ